MKSRTLNIFIGWDHKENVAYHTLANSIMRQSSVPVSITPLCLSSLRNIYNRPRDPKQSNDFSFTRFLVPYLSDYQGWSLFMDCDMLVRGDIAELWEERDSFKSVMVVKHDYTPKTETKFLGAKQYQYEKKNWSSVILFNCGHCHTKKLTTQYINTAPALDLHQFKWTEEDRIGSLPKVWNYLVGEYEPVPDAKIVHYTIGGPYFDEYCDCDYSDEWFNENRDVMHCDQKV